MAKTEFQQELSSAAANSVYLLKTEDDIITGILSLNQGGDVNKHIANLQEHLFTIGEIVGFIGENDPNAKIYANTNYIANGDTRKVAIEKLDAQTKVNADNIASNLILINQNASDIADIIASLGVDSGTAPLAVGIATLDADGKIPVSQMPNSLLQYQGTWDASTNTPTLADGTGTENYWYRVTVAGTQDLGSGSETYAVGDKVVHNGSIWQKWDTNDEVVSVFGRTGAVVAQTGDYTPAQVGLGNVTNDAQLKRAAADFDTFTEKVTPVEDDILLMEDSEDSFNKKKVKMANLLGGSGGGGSFVFELTGDVSPLESSYKGISLLDFDFESEMEVLALITVPGSYKPGDQIALVDGKFYSASAAGNVYFRCNTSLIKAGDDITAALNEHLSVNSELSLSTSNEVMEIGAMDLTTDTGLVNAMAVNPGDILLIKLFRDNSSETSSSIEDARFFKYSPSIDFAFEIPITYYYESGDLSSLAGYEQFADSNSSYNAVDDVIQMKLNAQSYSTFQVENGSSGYVDVTAADSITIANLTNGFYVEVNVTEIILDTGAGAPDATWDTARIWTDAIAEVQADTGTGAISLGLNTFFFSKASLDAVAGTKIRTFQMIADDTTNTSVEGDVIKWDTFKIRLD